MKWLQIEELASQQGKGARGAASKKAPQQAEQPAGERDRIQEMADEVQSDEEDMIVDEKDTDEITVRPGLY